MIYDIKLALHEIFEDFYDEGQMINIGNSFCRPKYKSACRDIL